MPATGLRVVRYFKNRATGVSQALGIESLQSIFPDKDPKAASSAVGAASRKKLQDAEDSFQNSELLKRLKEQTTSNSKKYYAVLPLCIACIHDVSIWSLWVHALSTHSLC